MSSRDEWCHDDESSMSSPSSSASDYDNDTALEASVKAMKYYTSHFRTKRIGTGLAYDEVMTSHHHPYSTNHPECSARVESIMLALQHSGLRDRMVAIQHHHVHVDDLLLIHDHQHIQFVDSLKDEQQREHLAMFLESQSAFASQGSVHAAYTAAGCVVSALEHIVQGKIQNAICVVRPPGHHAEGDHACGFCFFDNCAVAAAAGLKRMGLKRILIVDWDVHHGNGIQHAFEESNQVLYISLHRWENGEFYPSGPDGGPEMVGKGDGLGYNINIAWNGAGNLGDNEYLAAFDSIVMPAARAFDPEVVIVAAGFDACAGDPLGGCNVTPTGFAHMLHALTSLAIGRVVVALEGGYGLSGISACMMGCASVLLGDNLPKRHPVPRRPSAAALAAISKTLLVHGNTPSQFSKRWTKTARAFGNRVIESISEKMPVYSNDAFATTNTTTGINGGGLHTYSLAMQNQIEESEESEEEDEEEMEVMHAPWSSSHVSIATVTTGPAGGSAGDGPVYVRPLPDSANIDENVREPPADDDGCPDVSAHCQACASMKENWVCMKCYDVFCSREIHGHAVDHMKSTGHLIALSMADLSIWDYDLDAYLDGILNPRLRPILDRFHRKKFGVGLPASSSSVSTRKPVITMNLNDFL